MRKARAFIHLSSYEGNSIVCNEAMAMNLPCMFTDVGLMRDSGRPQDVRVSPPNVLFRTRGICTTSSAPSSIRSTPNRTHLASGRWRTQRPK